MCTYIRTSLPKEVLKQIETFEQDTKLDSIMEQIHQLYLNFSLDQFNIILSDLEQAKKHLNYLYPQGQPVKDDSYSDSIFNEQYRSYDILLIHFGRIYSQNKNELSSDKVLINRLIALGILA